MSDHPSSEVADSVQRVDIALAAIGLEELDEDFQVLRTALGAPSKTVAPFQRLSP